MQSDANPASADRALRRQRWQLLARTHRALEPVFVALSVVWIVLVVYELASGGLPRTLEVLVWAIWFAFVFEFAVALLIAPSRTTYLRKQWLTALSLLLPAVRVFRVASVLRLGGAGLSRSVRLVKLLTTINRGLAALGRTARRRGLEYVVAATLIVLVVGAAGMAFFEPTGLVQSLGQDVPSPAAAYADALWWTAYAMTTGAPTLPATGEGRLLGWLLSLYGLGVFGYLTAILASHFIGRDALEATYQRGRV